MRKLFTGMAAASLVASGVVASAASAESARPAMTAVAAVPTATTSGVTRVGSHAKHDNKALLGIGLPLLILSAFAIGGGIYLIARNDSTSSR